MSVPDRAFEIYIYIYIFFFSEKTSTLYNSMTLSINVSHFSNDKPSVQMIALKVLRPQKSNNSIDIPHLIIA